MSFSRFPRQVANDPRFCGRTRVLGAVCGCADGDGIAVVKVETLRVHTGLSGKTVKKWLAALVDEGYLVRRPRRNARGRQLTNEYLVVYGEITASPLRGDMESSDPAGTSSVHGTPLGGDAVHGTPLGGDAVHGTPLGGDALTSPFSLASPSIPFPSETGVAGAPPYGFAGKEQVDPHRLHREQLNALMEAILDTYRVPSPYSIELLSMDKELDAILPAWQAGEDIGPRVHALIEDMASRKREAAARALDRHLHLGLEEVHRLLESAKPLELDDLAKLAASFPSAWAAGKASTIAAQLTAKAGLKAGLAEDQANGFHSNEGV